MDIGDDYATRFVFKEVCISLGENISFFQLIVTINSNNCPEDH